MKAPVRLLEELVPPGFFEHEPFKVEGTIERQAGPFDFDGTVSISIDRGGLGQLIYDAVLARGRSAKFGPITVRFRGAAGFRSEPIPPDDLNEDRE